MFDVLRSALVWFLGYVSHWLTWAGKLVIEGSLSGATLLWLDHQSESTFRSHLAGLNVVFPVVEAIGLITHLLALRSVVWMIRLALRFTPFN